MTIPAIDLRHIFRVRNIFGFSMAIGAVERIVNGAGKDGTIDIERNGLAGGVGGVEIGITVTHETLAFKIPVIKEKTAPR